MKGKTRIGRRDGVLKYFSGEGGRCEARDARFEGQPETHCEQKGESICKDRSF
jgi:hypothetical protein